MYLKSLTLKGFKSFAKKTTLDFEKGITCVVGPNGSGKSNISDSILWVLGERSAKNIRGESMQDVIFAGTKAKTRAAMAEVSLCLDNSDGTLNLDFSQIEITRRMYRNGESDYWLNDAPVRRLDVLNILHDSGLGEGTHSIISQGSLDTVLSFDEMELKSIIEETAGILKHKQKKIKSMRKLELMQANVNRINDVVEEIERQLKPLAKRAKRADAYLEIKDELADANLKLAVDDHKKATSKKQELQKQASENERKCNEIAEVIEKANSQISELTEKIQEHNNLRGKNDAKNKKFSDLLNKLDSTCLLLNQVKDQLSAQSVRSTSDVKQAEIEIASLKRNLDDDSDKFDQAKQEQLGVSARIEEIQKEIDAFKEKIDECNAKIAEVNAEHEAREKRIRDLTDEINERIAEAEGKKARLQFLREKKESLAQDIEEAGKLLDSKREQIATTEELLRDVKMRDENAKELAKTWVNAKKSAEEALSKARVDFEATQAQLTALERIAKTQDVEASVADFVEKSENLTTDDFLMKSLTVEKGYEKVVEKVLSNFTQALVVADEASVLDVKDELKSDVSSLTLMLATANSPSNALGNADSLMDHVEVEYHAENAIKRILGNVYVCETLKDCVHEHTLHPEASFVTMDGEGAFADGAIKLVSTENDEADSGILFRKRQIEELMLALEKNKDAVSELTEKADEAVKSLSEAQEASLKISQQLAEIQVNFDTSKSDIERRVSDFEKLKSELSDVEQKIESANEEDLQSGRATLDELRENLASEEALRTNTDASLKKLNVDVSELRVKLDAKKSEDAGLKPQAAVLNERCSHLQSLKVTRESRIKEIEARIKKINDERETSQNRAEVIKNFVDKVKATQAVFESKISLFDFDFSESEADVKQMFEKLSTSREFANEKSKEKDAIFEATSAIKVELAKAEVEIDSATSRIKENFKGPFGDALELPELVDRETVQSRAAVLSKKMRSIGQVDLSVRAEFEALQERFDYLNSNLEDIRASIVAIEKIDEFIERRFKEQFESTFASVSENFSNIFTQLFPGGFGELSLTNPEDIEQTGVEISANPAGKKIRKISLLSGGEKSLVAMSFLFALHAIRQTPFYVLDEVEAALDDTNLVRLLTYINSLRETSQFIFITHQRRTMEMADVLFGVSMSNDGITKVISQKLSSEMLNLNEEV